MCVSGIPSSAENMLRYRKNCVVSGIPSSAENMPRYRKNCVKSRIQNLILDLEGTSTAPFYNVGLFPQYDAEYCADSVMDCGICRHFFEIYCFVICH